MDQVGGISPRLHAHDHWLHHPILSPHPNIETSVAVFDQAPVTLRKFSTPTMRTSGSVYLFFRRETVCSCVVKILPCSVCLTAHKMGLMSIVDYTRLLVFFIALQWLNFPKSNF